MVAGELTEREVGAVLALAKVRKRLTTGKTKMHGFADAGNPFERNTRLALQQGFIELLDLLINDIDSDIAEYSHE